LQGKPLKSGDLPTAYDAQRIKALTDAGDHALSKFAAQAHAECIEQRDKDATTGLAQQTCSSKEKINHQSVGFA